MTAGARVDRPPRVVTARNATVADKAAAWNAVQDAQRAVNSAVRLLGAGFGVELARFERALEEYARVTFSTRSPDTSRSWRTVAEAQRGLNQAARLAGVPEVEALDRALKYYAEIGGDPKRLPGDGGLS